MLKNTIILAVIILLVCTTSRITPINAQISDSRTNFSEDLKSNNILENKNFKNDENDDRDYSTQVNERFVINAMRNLYYAESVYVRTVGNGLYGNLNFLGTANLIDGVLASGEKYGYLFSISVSNGGNGDFPGFFINAQPRVHGRTGKNSFYMDISCQIRGADKGGNAADINDSIIETCAPFVSYEWENQMLLAIQEIYAAEHTYFSTTGNGNFGTLQNLVDVGLIDYFRSYYWRTWLRLDITSPTATTPAGFEIYGTPRYRETGIFSFYLNENGILRGADYQGNYANANSPPIIFEDEELIKFVMRTLATRQLDYRRRSDLGNGYYANTFEELHKAGLLNFDLSGDTFGGYQFEMLVNNFDTISFRTFEIRAIPANYSKESVRSFYVDRISPLRGADKGGKYADENDSIIEH